MIFYLKNIFSDSITSLIICKMNERFYFARCESKWGARGGKSEVWIGSLSFNFTDPKTI